MPSGLALPNWVQAPTNCLLFYPQPFFLTSGNKIDATFIISIKPEALILPKKANKNDVTLLRCF